MEIMGWSSSAMAARYQHMTVWAFAATSQTESGIRLGPLISILGRHSREKYDLTRDETPGLVRITARA